MALERLMTALRDATRDAHQRLEGLPFAEALSSSELPVESYVGYLQAMAEVHSELEQQITAAEDPRIASVWNDSMRKSHLLRQDLDYFASLTIRDIPAALSVADSFADWLAERSAASPLSMLGCLYVLEGSTLGGKTLAIWVRRTFRISEQSGMAYLQPYGDDAEKRWSEFSKAMNQLKLSESERSVVVEAALETFEQIGELIRTLYPFDPDRLGFSATTLNPDAGNHPITQDPLEIEAAQRAGKRSLSEFPYLIRRYGERGRRFTDSDGAWLVTLVGYPQPFVDQQIAWLTGVLAARGMPRLLMQRHLELLYEELSLRLPKKAAKYEKLLRTSEKLADERRIYMSDPQLEAISRRFDDCLGPDHRDRLVGFGSILAAAVVDEHAGMVGTLDSVRSWFDDPSKFPPELIDAAQQCISDAAAALRVDEAKPGW